MDLISRQAAIDAIEKLILPQVKGETAAEEINRVAWRCAINCAEKMIVHLPSVERHGRWEELYENNYKCSVCGSWWTCEGTPIESGMSYCPNCGARMDSNATQHTECVGNALGALDKVKRNEN